jgi:hemerythrin-like domain-containing protein
VAERFSRIDSFVLQDRQNENFLIRINYSPVETRYLFTMATRPSPKETRMEDLLNQNIKDIIKSWPATAQALADFNIGCTTCSLGTCRLRDIIEIHNLDQNQEHQLFTKIAAIIYPGQTVDIPVLPRKMASARADRKLSPPIRMLVEEHVAIKRVAAFVPAACAAFNPTDENARQTMAAIIDFIRGYADRYHHAKEEEILFGLFDANKEIISAMCQEHEIGRAHIRQAAMALEKGDLLALKAHLEAWANLLTEHIRKEDEILFPWMDRELKDTQVGRLYGRFLEVERELGAGVQASLRFSERCQSTAADHRAVLG